MLDDDQIAAASRTLHDHWRGGSKLDALEASLRPHDRAEGYAIQAGIGADKPLVLGAADDEFSMILSEAKDKLRWIPSRYVLGNVGLTGKTRLAYLAANRAIAKKGTAAIDCSTVWP